MSTLIPILTVVGRPIPLRGNDIDTDRIIPARFMKAITFDGLGEFAFLDVRRQQRRVVLEDGVVERRGKLAHLEQFVCGASR